MIEQIKETFFKHLKQLYPNVDTASIMFGINTDDKKQNFGDISTNAAMVLSKDLQRSPRDIAQQIIETFNDKHVKELQIAGPGFLNIFLQSEVYTEILEQLTKNQEHFFVDRPEKPVNYSIEFVSANPTGPLHLGHGRGGILGDVLGNILSFLGNKVTKEFYINDAGNQMQKLGLSFKIRCQQELGQHVELPEDAYHGEYLMDLAKIAVSKYGDKILEKDESFFTEYAEKHMLDMIKKTLSDYGIEYDVWFSEKSLHASDSVKRALKKLDADGYTYEQDGATWFKSMQFGDDKDRVLRRANGEVTYIAADVAYMEDKFRRGADHLIFILGQDHHSYVNRLQGILQATGFGNKPLDVILYQLVALKESGQTLKMSKRAGNMVTLREIIDLVGTDVARFFYLNRKADTHLDFDIDLALKKTEENPVFYLQYAYVRIKSILEKAQENKELRDINLKDAEHLTPSEHILLKKILSLKELLKNIGSNFQTHLLTYYILELAQLFHSYYNKNRVIDMDNVPVSRARLLVLEQLQRTFELVARLLEIKTPEKM
ncbi:arginine--tRNA ligase [candidate division TM6 bacterium RIFCSPHIGHO2_12_FULL_36_22]|nr:MAG: arginine--tRNA ligase [candidate division TM6 bacterium RIFCSPHIGHO2_12_FULL_36_22]